jgi:hypothetical protein
MPNILDADDDGDDNDPPSREAIEKVLRKIITGNKKQQFTDDEFETLRDVASYWAGIRTTSKILQSMRRVVVFIGWVTLIAALAWKGQLLSWLLAADVKAP